MGHRLYSIILWPQRIGNLAAWWRAAQMRRNFFSGRRNNVILSAAKNLSAKLFRVT
jgi:hypothetical protein